MGEEPPAGGMFTGRPLAKDPNAAAGKVPLPVEAADAPVGRTLRSWEKTADRGVARFGVKDPFCLSTPPTGASAA